MPRTGSLIRRSTDILMAALLLGVMAAPAQATAPSWTPTPPKDPCTSRDDYAVAPHGRFGSCADLSGASDWMKQHVANSGLQWVDSGTANPPGPLPCAAGTTIHADGWLWKCDVANGVNTLLPIKPWERPLRIAYAHSSTPTRANLSINSTTAMSGCRLSASEPRLMRGQSTTVSGHVVRRTLITTGVPPGIYKIRLTCPKARLNTTSDLLVRANGSVLLRSDCIDAWHDAKYGDIVPGYGRRLDAASAARASAECRKLAPLTADEYAQAGAEAYLRIGQIAEREVRRVSAATGMPICQAIAAVFEPVDTSGHPVDPWPLPYLDAPRPTAGYLADGFFPALYDAWTGGPVAMANIADCTTGNQALMLNAGYMTCDATGAAIGGSQDPHQTYPWYVFTDRSTCPGSVDRTELNPNMVCIVWGDRIGNNIVGGTGKVFLAKAAHDVNPYDCQDRALMKGQFAKVDVDFVPPLN